MTPEDHQTARLRALRGMHVPHGLHHHGHHYEFSRRQFLQASGLLVGAVSTASPWGMGTALAAKSGSGIPRQLPDFSPVGYEFLGVKLPWFTPPEVDPFTALSNPV